LTQRGVVFSFLEAEALGSASLLEAKPQMAENRKIGVGSK